MKAFTSPFGAVLPPSRLMLGRQRLGLHAHMHGPVDVNVDVNNAQQSQGKPVNSLSNGESDQHHPNNGQKQRLAVLKAKKTAVVPVEELEKPLGKYF